ncbi:helix-turn-helix transcriptional regulator, partial [Streptomyces niveus]
FHLDAPGWYQEPETPEWLPAVAEAVWDDRTVLARYRRQDAEVERELAPYGLVLKAGVWYLCARVDTAFRVYRIDRFTEVTLTRERFERDESFDLAAFWEERAAQFARSILRTEVVLRLSPDGLRRLPYLTDRASAQEAVEAAGPPDEDGWTTLTLPVESADVAFAQLFGFGPELEVLEPAELRARFADSADRTARLYR